MGLIHMELLTTNKSWLNAEISKYEVDWFKLTTASLIGGWVPETSRSFHFWQPAPWWRFLSWLENSGNPSISPNTGIGNRHPSNWINSGNRKGMGGESCEDEELPLLTTLQVHAQSTRSKYTQERLKRRAHGIPTHVICKKPLTTREHWLSLMLTPLNCI